MVSMKDIAARCGVSIATVSKALNDQPDIGTDTKKLICRTADELGYMTSSAARALKTNRTFNIGVLFVDEQNSGLTHEYFSSVLDALKVEAERNGYDITFISRNVGKKDHTYLQHCRYRGVDGVVIACVNFKDPQVVNLVQSGIPVVTIDHEFNNRTAVVSDNIAGMERLVSCAASKGHRKIGYIHGELNSVTEKRILGFYRACQKLGLKIPDSYLRKGVFHDTESCARETGRLLELPDPPTCILFPDDFSAIGGINEIRRRGLRIPEDISVAGYDGIHLAEMLSPPLTTYRQNTEELGRTAASRLIELIESPKTTVPERVTVTGCLIGGETLGVFPYV